MRRNSSHLLLGLILLCLASLFVAAIGDPASAAPRGQVIDTPIPPYHAVISEFRSRGPGGASNEFVEIFNPTGEKINIGGWLIRSVSNAGTMTTRYTVPLGIDLQPGQHYLVATTASAINPRDGDLTAGIADDGGVALTLANGTTVVDLVGMSSSAAEGTPLPQLVGLSDQSYERKPGGLSGSCYDTDNNANDFSVPPITPSSPQSLTSPYTPCAGAATATPTDTPTTTATPTDTGTPTQTGTATQTPTASNTPTATGTGTATHTPTATLRPPVHIVISEFRSRGPAGSDDEFVELFNPSAAAVNIGGWQIKKSSGCGTTITSLLTIPAGIILQPGQHYLAANTAAGVSSPDQTFSSTISDDGGVAVLASNDSIIDQVGMCATTTYREGTALASLTGTTDQSYQRRSGGCVDTNNNTSDFTIITPANPQNRLSPVTICAGAVTPTPSKTPTATPTFTPTKTKAVTPVPTAMPIDIVINEFLPHPRTDWNADGKANFGDEYIELINIGTQSVNLNGWKLDDDVDGSPAYKLPNITLLPRQIVHYDASETGISLSDGGDTVRLIAPAGFTVDAYTYPVVLNADVTWCRLPDGTGTWGYVCRPTPGEPNVRLEEGESSSGENPPGDQDGISVCLGSSVPEIILRSECTASGAGIWNWALWGSETEAWLQGGKKWDILFK